MQQLMKYLLWFVFTWLGHPCLAQSETTVTIIDFVKVKQGKRQEVLFFYEHNWKVYRDIALQKGYIKAYKLLPTTADTAADFDLILLTEYTDSLEYALSEQRFQDIMKSTRPNGPMLLNDLKPADFRQNQFFKQTETLFSASKPTTKRMKRRRA